MQITLPDGTEKELPDGATGRDLAESISMGLARNALAVDVNGEVRDLDRPLPDGATVSILTWESEGGQAAFWHSSAHLMAEALEALYPGVRLGIGPAIDNGFYYDVDLSETDHPVLSSDDFPAIEAKMKELARQDSRFERRDVSKAEAVAHFEDKGDPYKLELLEGLDDGAITFYTQGAFTDLCRGPHIASTKPIKAVKVLSLAGAYWRGDESRPQLTRIYGVSFPKQKLLDEHLERLELAKQRDHRKLGRELELFMFSDKVGPGLPIWLPKGARLREALVDFLKEEQVRRGYEPVVTPHIGRLDLFRTSGHYPYYADSQFPPMFAPQSAAGVETGGAAGAGGAVSEGAEILNGGGADEAAPVVGGADDRDGYLLKPMNCPHHTQIYAHKPRSYRDLPVRLAEFGTVYRYEQSGELGGLTRVRGFTQDDAHVFCRPDQVKGEFKAAIDLTLTVLRALDFQDFTAQISLRDPADAAKYIGEAAQWDAAEQAIREAASEMGLDTVEVEGEAAFYGPKLDFMVRDALGRQWQLGTVQVDYNLPERFDLVYTDEHDDRVRPVMLHRAPFGSLERFVGVLLEHTGGNLPLWLAPTQVKVLPITDDQNEYAGQVAKTLGGAGFRVETDTRSEKVGRKIRDAEVEKVPVMLVVGRKEAEAGTVSVRRHGLGDDSDQGSQPLDALRDAFLDEIARGLGRA
ncbi:threonine--tRNA ligase [Rubrivirga sp. S365]|uniref:Threonine--tRNA ligase n=1 Tax=Rubrivirga litoralis TaxID=3075598 RepID=A0ABU3BTK5_9BACT|nr:MULTISPECIES: threonine--tRNA ligase [unclassified Rubrivirga]MDT0632622.1 threonine--tRNA ligase [Rubrivirga sp. F394]MDT7855444.1 threonine--tRNA ligase [Rubrivirga sp. S365]